MSSGAHQNRMPGKCVIKLEIPNCFEQLVFNLRFPLPKEQHAIPHISPLKLGHTPYPESQQPCRIAEDSLGLSLKCIIDKTIFLPSETLRQPSSFRLLTPHFSGDSVLM